jgi:hypothetical protein
MVERLYEAFALYTSAGSDFCGHCYSPEDIARITRTPVRELEAETGRTLLWETADHWESADVYRHYLPRLLQLLGPPWRLEDIYPTHLFETLLALDFYRWPAREQKAVVDYLEQIGREPADASHRGDPLEWAAGIATLTAPDFASPESAAKAC